MHRPFALLAVLALSLLRAAVSAAAWTHDPSENLQMCSTFGNHLEPTISPDGAGGAYVAWTDQRALLSTGNDIYMQHITRDGTLDPAWPVNGLAIVTAPGDQVSPVSIPDGAGGVIVAWADHRAATWDVYAQRVLVNGVPAPGWPASGRLLGGHPTYDEIAPKIAGDGANGAYVVFTRIYSPGVDTDPILQRVLANGTVAPGFGPGVDLDNALSEQSQPAITADDSGGVVVAYRTNAAGNFDIKANRVAPNGVVMWAATLCNAAGDQTNPVIAGDGHNGAYVAWNDLRNPDQDVYVGHARGNGLILAPWPNGIDANAATGVDSVACVLPDVTGGVYVLWYRGQTTREAFAWHLDAGGQPPSFYSSPLDLGDASAGLAATADEFGEINVITGAVLPTLASKVVFTHAAAIYPGPSCVVSNVGSSVGQLALAPDGQDGAIAAWSDGRSGVQSDIFAQRIAKLAVLGSPEPVITSVRDVANDQGGQVRVSWLASYLDAASSTISEYRLWRQVPVTAAQHALASGAAVLESDAAGMAARGSPLVMSGAAKRRVLRTSIQADQVYYWELVNSLAPAAYPGYSMVAPTTGDSIAGSNPYTVFMVDAAYFSQAAWSSQPDSGYSVDNLAPVAPAPFTATFSPPNGTFLSWGPNSESDLAGYRLYRGGGLNFTPSPANLIYQGTLPSFQDAVTTPYIYKVRAYDVHGNEGPIATAQPAGTSTAENDLPRELTLAPVMPNPVHGDANFRLGVPRDARIELSIYDAQGRRVRRVLGGMRSAGWVEARWDGRDESGARVASGLYFARLDADSKRIVRRFTRLE